MRGAGETALQVHDPRYEVGRAPRGESMRIGAPSDEGLPRCEGGRAQVVRVQARREPEILEGKGGGRSGRISGLAGCVASEGNQRLESGNQGMGARDWVVYQREGSGGDRGVSAFLSLSFSLYFIF